MKNRISGLFAFFVAGILALSCWQGSPSSGTNDYPAANYSSSPKVSSTPSNGNSSNNTNTNMSEKTKIGFSANLPSGFVEPTDEVGKKLLREYGSFFVARGGVTPPSVIVFKDESEVSAFQSKLSKSNENIGGFNLELQSAAMDDLKKALADAKSSGLSISPRDADSAKRTYNETVGLWKSRVEPALKHWVGKGKLTQAEADRIKAMSPYEQVPEVLKLEEKGIFFAKDLSKSIIYSVAPPGTSQHLSMLALDVKEHDNAKVRELLAKYHWYQTVVSDLPHFTYLGADESALPGLGLKKMTEGGRVFWVPDI
ncbi:MAG: hypothetical protein ACRD6X_12930 [Pyrinomonadaceae bacterium]